MATGLTFGSIAALYGLTNDLVTQAQYSQLVTVVIFSAFIPTLIAQQFFEPDLEDALGVQETAGEEDFARFHPTTHRRRISAGDTEAAHQVQQAIGSWRYLKSQRRQGWPARP